MFIFLENSKILALMVSALNNKIMIYEINKRTCSPNDKQFEKKISRN